MKRLQRTTVNITGLKCQKCRTCLWTMCGLMTSSCALAVEQTFYVFVYEIAEDEVRYRYGLMGAPVGQCLMSDIVRVVGPDEEGISI